jgi:excisionase family DNA binding protein
VFLGNNSTTMEALYKKTNREDQSIAEKSVPYLKLSSEKVRQNKAGGTQVKIMETGDLITIPRKALFLLTEILEKMAMGKSITIIPSDSNITTQQAADILNVSRPFVVKMLEKGDIPFNKVGTHRRIKLSDIISYDKMSSEQRSENLDFLAQQAQNLNLGYE